MGVRDEEQGDGGKSFLDDDRIRYDDFQFQNATPLPLPPPKRSVRPLLSAVPPSTKTIVFLPAVRKFIQIFDG